jgi:hypothetical protein
MGDSLVTDMTAPVGKAEASRDGSTDSIGSSPEPGLPETYTQEEPQQQKRKGGRKPVSLPDASCLPWLQQLNRQSPCRR